MRKPLLLSLCLAGLTLVAVGCRSNHTARQRFHDTPGSLGDTTARSAYVDRRVSEMTEKGMKAEDAAAQASREWFNQASVVPSDTPTTWERQRREAQAKFEADLAKQKKEASVR
jgi:hypothetical protein